MPKTPVEGPPHTTPPPDRSLENLPATAIALITLTMIVLLLAIPSLRDWLIVQGGSTDRWPKPYRVDFVNWVEWIRIALEAALALTVGGLVFNRSLTAWSKAFADRSERELLRISDSLVNDELGEFLEARKEVHQLVSGKKGSWFLADLMFVVLIICRLGFRPDYQFLTVLMIGLWSWVLRRFAGGLHGMTAAILFLGVLVTKALKQLTDSPVWTS